MGRPTCRSVIGKYAPVLPLFALCACASLILGAPRQEPSPRPAQSVPGNSHVIWAPGLAHGPENLNLIFQYKDFNDVSGLTFNGNAEQAGRLLFVTPPAGSQAGSVWYSNQVNVAQGFQTSFGIELVPGNSCIGDGLAFLVQNSGLSALGVGGGSLGYAGIANSLAVEFDTYLNTENDDPNNNHIGIQSCGTAPNTADHGTCHLGLQPNPPVTLSDGKGHLVSVGYFPGGKNTGLLTVSIDHQIVLTSPVNLSTLLSLNGNDAWVGFTAGTGACLETNAVRAWEFGSVGSADGE